MERKKLRQINIEAQEGIKAVGTTNKTLKSKNGLYASLGGNGKMVI